jgi:hypothetical protein
VPGRRGRPFASYLACLNFTEARWTQATGSRWLPGSMGWYRFGRQSMLTLRYVEWPAPDEERKQSCGGSRRKGHEDLATLPPCLQGCATQADPARRGRDGPSWSGRSRAVR